MAEKKRKSQAEKVASSKNKSAKTSSAQNKASKSDTKKPNSDKQKVPPRVISSVTFLVLQPLPPGCFAIYSCSQCISRFTISLKENIRDFLEF